MPRRAASAKNAKNAKLQPVFEDERALAAVRRLRAGGSLNRESVARIPGFGGKALDSLAARLAVRRALHEAGVSAEGVNERMRSLFPGYDAREDAYGLIKTDDPGRRIYRAWRGSNHSPERISRDLDLPGDAVNDILRDFESYEKTSEKTSEKLAAQQTARENALVARAEKASKAGPIRFSEERVREASRMVFERAAKLRAAAGKTEHGKIERQSLKEDAELKGFFLGLKRGRFDRILGPSNVEELKALIAPPPARTKRAKQAPSWSIRVYRRKPPSEKPVAIKPKREPKPPKPPKPLKPPKPPKRLRFENPFKALEGEDKVEFALDALRNLHREKLVETGRRQVPRKESFEEIGRTAHNVLVDALAGRIPATQEQLIEIEEKLAPALEQRLAYKHLPLSRRIEIAEEIVRGNGGKPFGPRHGHAQAARTYKTLAEALRMNRLEGVAAERARACLSLPGKNAHRMTPEAVVARVREVREKLVAAGAVPRDGKIFWTHLNAAGAGTEYNVARNAVLGKTRRFSERDAALLREWVGFRGRGAQALKPRAAKPK